MWTTKEEVNIPRKGEKTEASKSLRKKTEAEKRKLIGKKSCPRGMRSDRREQETVSGSVPYCVGRVFPGRGEGQSVEGGSKRVMGKWGAEKKRSKTTWLENIQLPVSQRKPTLIGKGMHVALKKGGRENRK